MAENTALALLSNQQQQSAQVFGQIMGAMNAVHQTAQQTAQMTFAVAAKEGQMREEARMNDARVHQMNFQNSYYAAKHNAEMELMPIKMENERMQLEAAKLNQKNALLKNQTDMFNNFTSGRKAIAAARMSDIQDPAYAEGYIGLESKWKGALANGATWDDQAFGAEFDELNRRFEGAEPKSGYNPRTSYYLKAMGAEAASIRYEANNPNFKPNLTAIKSQLITGTEQYFQSVFAKDSPLAGLFSPEQVRAFAHINETYRGLEDRIKSQQELVDRKSLAMTAIAAKEGPQSSAVDAYKRDYDLEVNQLSRYHKQKDDLYNNGMDEKDVTIADYKQPPKANELLGVMAEQAKSPDQAQRMETSPVPPTYSAPNFPLQQQQADMTPIIQSRFSEATQGINFRQYQGVDLQHQPEKVKEIQNGILRNLQQKTNKEMEDLFSQHGAWEGLFSDTSGDPTSVEGFFSSDARREGGYNQPGFDRGGITVGKRTAGQEWRRVFMENPDRRFSSPDDIRKFISEFEGTEEGKNKFMKDVYAMLVTANIKNAYHK